MGAAVADAVTGVDAPALVPGVPPGRRALGRAVRMATALLLLVATAMFAGLALGPHLLNYRTETMLSGSMSPWIRPGDVAVDTLEPLDQLEVGQVITYHIPTGDQRVVSHRVVHVTRTADGDVLVRTKGDANAQPDPWQARLQDGAVWRVRAVVPGLGRAIGLLRGKWLMFLLRTALVAFVADTLIGIWRRSTPTGPVGP